MPISDCEALDPRIRRTRQLLQGALAKLMQVKSFEEISVQDITDEATVNRATFYDHYTDKYALLDAMAAYGFHSMLRERQIAYDGSCPAAIGALIRTTCDFLWNLQQQGHCHKHSAFEPLMDAAVVKAIERVLLEGVSRHKFPDSLPPETVAAAVSWAIYAAVKRSLNTPNPAPADEIVPKVLHLVLPMLKVSSSASVLESMQEPLPQTGLSRALPAVQRS